MTYAELAHKNDWLVEQERVESIRHAREVAELRRAAMNARGEYLMAARDLSTQRARTLRLQREKVLLQGQVETLRLERDAARNTIDEWTELHLSQ